jgi:leucine dehydrogenase
MKANPRNLAMLRMLDKNELQANIAYSGHEAVAAVRDEASGLQAFIAIHDTRLGPALGGCRYWIYSDERAALTDVLRLSRSMTYKNALADLALGGGKAVIMGDPRRDKTRAKLLAFGRAVDELAGRYITAEDVGINPRDMDGVAEATAHVRGTTTSVVSDPSPYTAHGVFHGIRAAVAHRFGAESLEGLTACVQGLGHVGFRVAEKLHQAGARLLVSDIYEPAVERAVTGLRAQAVPPSEAHRAPADVFVPCALGAILSRRTIPEIRAAVVAGAANNQLAEPDDAQRLRRRRIVYAPDYVINAGGVIAIALGQPGADRRRIMQRVEAIGHTVAAILSRADAEGLASAEIADRMAEERLAAGRARSAA